MASVAKLSISIAVVPLSGNDDIEGKEIYVVDEEIGRALTGGNNASTWAGNAIANWADGVLTNHASGSGGSVVTSAGDNGVWIKHTGYAYDAGEDEYIDRSTVNTAAVSIVVNTKTIAALAAGEAIYLPTPGGTTFGFTCSGTPAVEYAIFT